jgi:hypothetical protein
VINNEYVRRGLVRGQRLRYVQGGVTEFNGLTELSFPTYDVLDDDVDPATGNAVAHEELVPPPVDLDPKLFNTRSQDAYVQLEKLEGAIVGVAGGTVCPIPPEECVVECAPCNQQNVCFDQLPFEIQQFCQEPLDLATGWANRKDYCSDCKAFSQFGQWKINFGDCGFNAIAVSTTGQASFDPRGAAAIGQPMSYVAGALTNVAGISDCSGNNFSFWVIKPRDDNDVICPDGPCPGQAPVEQMPPSP